MDADDKMLPTRLERQFDYMQTHPDVAFLGTQSQGIEWETGRTYSPTRHPEQVTNDIIEHQRTNSQIFFLNHPTVMFRPQAVLRLGGYPAYRIAQDLGLWLRAIRAGLKIHNLQTVELHYGLHSGQVSKCNGVRLEEYAKIIEECWTDDMRYLNAAD
jgi:amylovoran biosynthesis glycosyltransferase AmsE